MQEEAMERASLPGAVAEGHLQELKAPSGEGDIHQIGNDVILSTSSNGGGDGAAAAALDAGGEELSVPPSPFCCGQFRTFCWNRRYRLVGAAILLVTVIVAAACWKQVQELWELYTGWLETNKTAGAVTYVAVTALLTVICFPAAIPTLAAGAIYGSCFGLGKGIAVGSTVVFFGATAGSLVSFFLGRYAFHGCLETLTSRSRWARALDLALQNNGLKVIILMRLSPVVPYSVFNYMAALTSVSSRDFIIGQVAVIPGTILFVFLGAQSAMAIQMATGAADGSGDEDDVASGSLEESPALRVSLLVAGVVLAVGAVALMGYYAKRELRRSFVPGLDTMESARVRGVDMGRVWLSSGDDEQQQQQLEVAVHSSSADADTAVDMRRHPGACMPDSGPPR